MEDAKDDYRGLIKMVCVCGVKPFLVEGCNGLNAIEQFLRFEGILWNVLDHPLVQILVVVGITKRSLI